MAADQPTEALSMLFSQRPPLDVVMRGYDRRQVEELLERLETEADAAMADRDAALARSAHLAAQLTNAYAEIESLRHKLRTETSSVVTAENVSDRIRAMLELAEEEASRLREEANHYAMQVRHSIDEEMDRIRSEGRAEAERLTSASAARLAEIEASYQARIAEGDRYLAEQRALAASESRASRAALETEIAPATADRHRLDAERERLDVEHLAARDAADAAAAARRETAMEDFEIALRHRRTAEEHKDDERRRAFEELARTTVDDANRQAGQLVAGGRAQLASLNALSEATMGQLRSAGAAISLALEALSDDPPEAQLPEVRLPEAPPFAESSGASRTGGSAAAAQPSALDLDKPRPAGYPPAQRGVLDAASVLSDASTLSDAPALSDASALSSASALSGDSPAPGGQNDATEGDDAAPHPGRAHAADNEAGDAADNERPVVEHARHAAPAPLVEPAESPLD
ncbi:MAG: hypothetical protein LBQ06_02400 [Frankiaceae bacterium]|jgi:cell division septum initiation protein DivIVA|nr:hypothetical protein [Frankiaceae bacterium]